MRLASKEKQSKTKTNMVCTFNSCLKNVICTGKKKDKRKHT